MESKIDCFSSKDTIIQVLTDTLSNCKFESAADVELKAAIEKWLKISDPYYIDMNMIVNRYKLYALKADVYVRVTKPGSCYLRYTEFLKKHIPTLSKYYPLYDNLRSGYDNLRSGDVLLLIRVASHLTRPSEKVCICQNTTTHQVYLIEAGGVMFLSNDGIPRDDYKEYSKPYIEPN